MAWVKQNVMSPHSEAEHDGQGPCSLLPLLCHARLSTLYTSCLTTYSLLIKLIIANNRPLPWIMLALNSEFSPRYCWFIFLDQHTMECFIPCLNNTNTVMNFTSVKVSLKTNANSLNNTDLSIWLLKLVNVLSTGSPWVQVVMSHNIYIYI